MTAEWEGEARRAEEYGVRTVIVRTAPVLGKAGMLAALTQTARFGFLVRLTKKNYWFSWIHEDDIVATYLFALETTTLQGVVNASAPQSLRYQTFMRYMSLVLHRFIIGSLPQFVSQKVFGDLLSEITKNARIVPQRLIDKGFEFHFPDIKSALKNIYKKEETEQPEKSDEK